MWTQLKTTLSEFSDDECALSAAALAYYAVFSLPALLVLIITVCSLFLDPQSVQNQLGQQIAGVVGAEGRQEIQTMMERAQKPGGGVIGMTIGVAALLFGASGVMLQLQSALNKAWDVQPDPARGGIRNFVFKRMLSFAMVLAIAFLLLVSLVISAFLTTAGDWFAASVGARASEPLLQALNFAAALLVITALFAAMYKWLPDAMTRWRDVWIGALAAGVLFMVGKYLLAWYIGSSNPASSYGAAGSLVLILLWVYYTGMIVLFGAEFSQVHAFGRGSRVEPKPGAVRLVRKKEPAPPRGRAA